MSQHQPDSAGDLEPPETSLLAGDADVETDTGPETGAEVDSDRGRHGVLVLAIAAAVVAVDQLTKWWALERLDRGDIDLIGSLRFNLVFNSGTAFSLGGDNGPIFAVIAMVVAVVLFQYGRRADNNGVVIAVALVLGGAVGNLVDRAFRSSDGFLRGRVIDFVDLQWWPVFNVADAAIVCGSAMLILFSMRAE